MLERRTQDGGRPLRTRHWREKSSETSLEHEVREFAGVSVWVCGRVSCCSRHSHTRATPRIALSLLRCARQAEVASVPLQRCFTLFCCCCCFGRVGSVFSRALPCGRHFHVLPPPIEACEARGPQPSIAPPLHLLLSNTSACVPPAPRRRRHGAGRPQRSRERRRRTESGRQRWRRWTGRSRPATSQRRKKTEEQPTSRAAT